MADWKSQVLQNFEVTKDMVDYVNVKYDTNDKAIGTEIIDDVDKENVNVEVVLNKPKNNKLKGKELIILDLDTCNFDDSWEPTKSVNKINSKFVLKGKHGTSSVSFKGRKDDHGSVFRGKPGKSSVYSKGKKMFSLE
ncbi:hypothetical protein Tco_1036000 [Tanacetum coccineum]